ncbi:MFS transporter [Sneathiella marina]|uniref:MFS transporter n=1 Tax=Sneathiella marina TaxID=2950108 RepID=A0ABY4W1C4_9PROT|nr:MFS transporter [Sneathiella marina]USG60646.1 MFS transporter [Sneathiella marina]
MLAARLAPFYFTLFLIVGFQLPFWPVWLSHKGLSLEQIGIVISAPVWIKIAFIPIFASLADRLGRRKALLLILSAISLCLYQLYFAVDGFWQILALGLVIGVFISPFTTLGDNLVLTLARTHKIDYARIRLWGSISFILASVGGGWLLEGRSPDYILKVIVISAALLFLCCLLLPETKSQNPKRERKGLRRLLKNRRFMAFLVTAGLIQASHAVLYTSGTLQWQQQGISDTAIGLLWAEGVIVEIILFALAHRFLKRFSPIQLLLLGGFAGFIRWLVMGFEPGFDFLLLLQVLHGFTFASAHLGAMRYISETIPLEISARAQGLYSAISVGLIMGASLFLSGYLFKFFAAGAYFFMAGGCFLALIIGAGILHYARTSRYSRDDR